MSFENGVFVPHSSEGPVAVADRAHFNGARGGDRSRNGRGREGRRDNDSSNWRLRDGDGGDRRGWNRRRNDQGRNNRSQVLYHGNQRIPSLMDQEDGLDNAEVPEQTRQNSSNNAFAFNPDATSFQPSFDTPQQARGERQQQPYLNDNNRNKNKNQAPSFVHGRYNQSSTESVQLFNNLERRRNNGSRYSDTETRRGVKDRQHFGRNNPSKKSNSAETETSTSSNSSEVDSSSLTRVPGADGRKKIPDIRNQRERLSDQLNRNACECMICVERVDRSNRIWSCSKCFNIFHLHCVSTWANSSKDEVGWRCPGCQSYCEDIPLEYRCFCSKLKNPVNSRSDIPHTCGQMCGRKGPGGVNCKHTCSMLCHPGPCPQCEAVESRNCCCGKIQAQVKCSSKAVLTCEDICDKILNCGVHKCKKQCHIGPCNLCTVKLNLECHCKTETKEEICTNVSAGVSFSCKKTCGKLLRCKQHKCESTCHFGPCKPCKLSPEAVLCCPCGQTPVEQACLFCRIPQRKTCLDRIPVCGKVCGRIFACGNAGDEHRCKALCHVQLECPKCQLITSVKCKCGSKTFDINCGQFDPSKQHTCEKRCTKKRACGKHKCTQRCCIETDHICPIICDRALRCGSHKCNLLCHNGHCPPCRVVSFEELSCECGASVIYPPVSCGTKPPLCSQPCIREHDCDHAVMHNCHSDAQCPPCTFLTKKRCHGDHEERKNIMCHIKEFSCGMPCKKLLSCGRHDCQRTCHGGNCLSTGQNCKLPCNVSKPECGHPCGSECHDGACPESKCKIVSDVTCPCGRRKDTMICWKREKEYDRLVYYLMNIELKRLREGEKPKSEEEMDANSILSLMKSKTPKANVLECDKECTRLERNRKMMEALQLEDPDATSTFGTPNYSEFLTSFTKKNPKFVENTHDRFTNLVVKAKRSKRKNETYGFECMNRDKRKVVHEYAEHFGCLTESFDEEPNRNVVCTASKDKSYLPAVSLVDAVFRPSTSSSRKNAFNDVEIFQNSKSQIMGPANGKIWSIPNSASNMVSLAPQSTVVTPAPTPPTLATITTNSSSSNINSANNNHNSSSSSALPVFSGDFPPLS